MQRNVIIAYASLLLIILMLFFVLLHYSLTAALCDYNIVDSLALLPPNMFGDKSLWSNMSACKMILFHEENQVFVVDIASDCIMMLNTESNESELIGTDCSGLIAHQGWLFDQAGGLRVKLEEEKTAIYSKEGLYLCT